MPPAAASRLSPRVQPAGCVRLQLGPAGPTRAQAAAGGETFKWPRRTRNTCCPTGARPLAAPNARARAGDTLAGQPASCPPLTWPFRASIRSDELSRFRRRTARRLIFQRSAQKRRSISHCQANSASSRGLQLEAEATAGRFVLGLAPAACPLAAAPPPPPPALAAAPSARKCNRAGRPQWSPSNMFQPRAPKQHMATGWIDSTGSVWPARWGQLAGAHSPPAWTKANYHV